MEQATGFEPATFGLENRGSTIELHLHVRAEALFELWNPMNDYFIVVPYDSFSSELEVSKLPIDFQR